MNDYKRRVRIEYKPFETHPELHKKPVGYTATVHDADTGEEIPNISDIVVYLRVSSINEAAITYYEDADRPGNLRKKRAMSANPELDVYAMERRTWLETVVFQALGEASMCWEEGTRGRFMGEEAKRIGNELIAILEEHYLRHRP